MLSGSNAQTTATPSEESKDAPSPPLMLLRSFSGGPELQLSYRSNFSGIFLDAKVSKNESSAPLMQKFLNELTKWLGDPNTLITEADTKKMQLIIEFAENI